MFLVRLQHECGDEILINPAKIAAIQLFDSTQNLSTIRLSGCSSVNVSGRPDDIAATIGATVSRVAGAIRTTDTPPPK